MKTGRKCACCEHPRRKEIDKMLLTGIGTYKVSARFGLSQRSVYRHSRTHLRQMIQQSKELRMLADNESLTAEVNRLHAYVNDVLEHGRQSGDDRLVLLGVDTGRRNVEALNKIAQEAPLKQQIRDLQQQVALRDALLANFRLAAEHEQQQQPEHHPLTMPDHQGVKYILRTLIEMGGAIDMELDGTDVDVDAKTGTGDNR